MNELIFLISFNILNIADKITTYFGIKYGFYELNNITFALVQKYGLSNAITLKIMLGLILSIIIYLQYKKVPNVFRNFLKYGTFFIIMSYSFAVINNIYWLNTM